jgi:hypothetical protein
VNIVLKAAFEVEMAGLPVRERCDGRARRKESYPRAKRDEPGSRLRLVLDLYKASDR